MHKLAEPDIAIDRCPREESKHDRSMIPELKDSAKIGICVTVVGVMVISVGMVIAGRPAGMRDGYCFMPSSSFTITG